MKALTAREAEALQRVANGETYRQIAKDWGVEEITVRTTGARVMKKLGANTISHAVHLAWQAGIFRRERHGDHAGYTAHLRRGEPPCDDCAKGEIDYRAARRGARRSRAAA
ncbi:LuxR C-terminal-related transcriptional regulator [Streptomyces sp. NPDC014793]|uniref:LuxR C-terminal-related transcriptional regulator n=1 Tax=Streptomyces sp. NPDC014793 TaxID=3364914 RepID=UPI0036F61B42